MPGLSRGVLVCLLTIAVGCSATDGLVYGVDASRGVNGGRTVDGALGDRAPTGELGPLVVLDRPMAGDAEGDAGAATGGDATTLDGSPVEGDGGAASDGSTADGSRADGSVAAPCGSREVCNNGLDDNCNGRIDEDCVCIPGTTTSCYKGPTTRAGVGVCNLSTQRCEGDGEFGRWGACTGSGQPQPMRCGEGLDFACTGVVDDGCACAAGTSRPCYGGPMGTRGVGACVGGTQSCRVTKGVAAWSACVGEVTPEPDQCDGFDRDCDGNALTGCGCAVGTSRGCYTGPMATAGVGTCREGVSRCVAVTGGAGSEWGPCAGEVLPAMNLCDGIDRACTGSATEGCECAAGATRPCYSGAAGTRGVGACRDGMQSCVVAGGRSMWATACAGEALPGTEVCSNRVDDNCNGAVDEGCGGTLTCPGDQTVPAGSPIALTAMGVGLRNVSWTLVSAPTGGVGSVVWAPAPPTALTETFTPFIVGAYVLRVSGTDVSGRVITCMFTVTALPHGLRVQLSWNGTGDVDLHVHNANRTAWFNGDDCYYGNLRPAWGAVLDFDNTSNVGPENTRLDSPAVGATYTIGVHNYARAAGRVATVQIFCGSTTSTTPTATLMSRAFTLGGSGNCANNDFWRVAQVTMTSATTCTVTPINTYTTGSGACSGP
nr:hypothetical protein [Deltaproteobacteria bacterium]